MFKHTPAQCAYEVVNTRMHIHTHPHTTHTHTQHTPTPNTHNMYVRTHIQHAHTHRTGMSYRKSLLAVGGVLEFLKTRVSVCTAMVDSLLSAVQQSQVCITDPSGDY